METARGGLLRSGLGYTRCDVGACLNIAADHLGIKGIDTLEQLAVEDTAAARIVELCYFGGFTVEEAAEVLDISRATAYRHWTYAKAWLHVEIQRDG